MIDAHAHLSAAKISGCVDQLIGHLRAMGIKHVVLGGFDPADWQRQRRLSQIHPGLITTAAGMHPWVVRDNEQNVLHEMFEQLRVLSPEFDLIGEVGFDFFKDNSTDQKLKQLYWCERQLELAMHLRKPVVLHVVRGHDRMLKLLDRFEGLRGIIHAFTGGHELARDYVRRGFVLSLGHRFFNREKARDVAWLKDLPYVLESDAPNYKDQELDPHSIALAWILDLKTSARALSNALGINTDQVWSQAELNLQRLLHQRAV